MYSAQNERNVRFARHDLCASREAAKRLIPGQVNSRCFGISAGCWMYLTLPRHRPHFGGALNVEKKIF